MIRRTITTPSTVGQRIRNVVLLAGGVLITYGGIRTIPNMLDARARKTHATEVRELIDAGHLEQASSLLASHRAADGLRQADALALDALLATHQRTAALAQTAAPFEAAVAQYDYGTATAELQRLRGTLPPMQLRPLEQRLESISDEGMFQRILTANPGERESLLRTYLAHYPTGTHRRDVAVYAIAEHTDALLAMATARSPITRMLPQLQTFTALCTAYGQEAVPLPNAVRLAAVEPELSKYLADGLRTPTDDLLIGDRVQTLVLELSDIPLSNKYLNERNRNFPQGSIGYVTGTKIDDNKRLVAYVEFLNTSPNWSEDWSVVPAPFRKPTVAAYYAVTHSKATELMRQPLFTSAEHSLLQLELERLQAAIKPLLPIAAPESDRNRPGAPLSLTGSEPRVPAPALMYRGSQVNLPPN